MHIGPYPLHHPVFVAPMAGVTDRPFRMLCKQLGAAYAVSEMVTSRKDLWSSLNVKILEYLSGVTLANLVASNQASTKGVNKPISLTAKREFAVAN